MQYQCKQFSVTAAKHTPKQYHSNTHYNTNIDTQNNKQCVITNLIACNRQRERLDPKREVSEFFCGYP